MRTARSVRLPSMDDFFKINIFTQEKPWNFKSLNSRDKSTKIRYERIFPIGHWPQQHLLGYYADRRHVAMSSNTTTKSLFI